MRTGEDVSELDFSDHGSVTSSDDEASSSESSEDDDARPHNLQFAPFAAAAAAEDLLPFTPTTPGDVEAEYEFRNEVKQSLERAFAENHSVDNAAVELKTLRMASNVSLNRVREAVIAAIVGRIAIVPGGVAAQRKEITSVIDRWGELINKIGGVDAVETVSILQV